MKAKHIIAFVLDAGYTSLFHHLVTKTRLRTPDKTNKHTQREMHKKGEKKKEKKKE